MSEDCKGMRFVTLSVVFRGTILIRICQSMTLTNIITTRPCIQTHPGNDISVYQIMKERNSIEIL